MKKQMNNVRIGLLSCALLGVFFSMSGCDQNLVVRQVVERPPLKIPPSRAKVRHFLIKKLGRRDVQVIHLGETIRIVILSDNLFHPTSANLRADYRRVLRDVALLIRSYDETVVKVVAYTDNRSRVKLQQALTTRQAQVVQNYLASHGVKARLVYAVGKNRLNPVDWNGSAKGRNNNRRVEISFRYYPHTVPYN